MLTRCMAPTSARAASEKSADPPHCSRPKGLDHGLSLSPHPWGPESWRRSESSLTRWASDRGSSPRRAPAPATTHPQRRCVRAARFSVRSLGEPAHFLVLHAEDTDPERGDRGLAATGDFMHLILLTLLGCKPPATLAPDHCAHAVDTHVRTTDARSRLAPPCRARSPGAHHPRNLVQPPLLGPDGDSLLPVILADEGFDAWALDSADRFRDGDG